MNSRNSRYRHWAIGALLVVVMIFGLAKISLHNHSVSESSNQKSYRLSVALVNEDIGGNFNQSHYDFGKNFVNMVTQDTTNQWTVTSRSIADSGLKHKVYEMVIVIPANFTEKTLQLQSTNPQSASIQYKLNTSKNSLIRAQAESKVNNLLQLFNQRIVNMYFSSIVGNLHDAQTSVGGMVTLENQLNGSLSQKVNQPFTTLNDQFTTITAQGKEIESGYDDWKQQSDAYNTETKAVMTTVLNSGKTTLEGLTAFNEAQASQMKQNKSTMTQYFQDSQNKQQDLLDKDYDKLLANNQKSQDAYKKQYEQSANDFTNLKNNNLTQLEGINTITGGDLSQGEAYQYLKDQTNRLKPALTLMNMFYSVENNVITQQSDALKDSQKQLREFFTGSDDGDISDQSVVQDHIQQTILDELDQNQNKSPDVNTDTEKLVESNISEMVAGVPSNTNNLISWLKYFASATPETVSDVQKQSKLIDKFAEEHHVQRDASTVMASSITDILNKANVVTNQKITLPLDGLMQGQSVTLKVSVPNALSMDENKLLTDTKTQLASSHAGSFSVSATDGSLTIKANSQTSPVSISLSPEFTLKPGNLPTTVIDNDQFDVPYQVQLVANSSDEAAATSSTSSSAASSSVDSKDASKDTTTDTNATDGETKADSQSKAATTKATTLSADNHLTVRINTDALKTAAKKDLKQLAPLLTQIGKASGLIANYYGDSADSQFDLGNDKTLANQAADHSLYTSLRNTNINSAVALMAAQQLAPSFSEQAVATDSAISSQIKTLDKQANSPGFAEQYQNQVDAINAHADAINELTEKTVDWYRRAMAYVNNANPTPMTDLVLDQTKLPLDLVKTPELQDDTESGPALVKQFQESLAESQSEITQTADDAAKVKDMTPYFKGLQSSTTTLQKSSRTIVDNAGDLTKQWGKAVDANGNYSKNFSEVLKNTKSGGADNSNVYRYLANPIRMKNEGEITSKTSIMPYYLTLIVTMITMFTAYVLSRLEVQRRIKVLDRFTNTDSLIWKNLPWTTVIGVSGLIEGLLLAVVSRSILQTSQISVALWVLIVVGLQTALLGVATYLLRQFRSAGMFVLLAVTAMYLFFTPSIGVKVISGTATKLLTNISPLQMVETTFTRLSSGAGLGTWIYLGLLAAAITSVCLNLVVFHKQPKLAEEASSDEQQSLTTETDR